MTTKRPQKRRPGRPKRRNVEQTRSEILRAAISMFSAGGYVATSLRQISSAANVDLATLKYHFQDKATLYGEAYKVGHERFLAYCGPALAALGGVDTVADAHRAVRKIVSRAFDFLSENDTFIRMTLFRILEDSDETIGVEDELQVLTISVVDDAFESLRRKGIVREFDRLGFVSFLLVGLPMWWVSANTKPGLIGEPAINSPAGRERGEEMIVSLLERHALLEYGATAQGPATDAAADTTGAD